MDGILYDTTLQPHTGGGCSATCWTPCTLLLLLLLVVLLLACCCGGCCCAGVKELLQELYGFRLEDQHVLELDSSTPNKFSR